MTVVPINIWAVLVSTIILMAVGFLWYGPLFGKEWARLSGLSMENMKMKNSSMILLVIGSLVMSFIFAHTTIFAGGYLHLTGTELGLMVGFFNWIGFIAPVTLGAVLWEGKPWKLWILNNGYYLVSFLLMGLVFAYWM